jgi:hypothetical protein
LVLDLAQVVAERHAQDLRDTWQGRALAATRGQGTVGAVLLSVLAHNFDEHMPVLLRAVFPGFDHLVPRGILTTAGRIMKNGAVVADVFRAVGKGGFIEKKVVLYRNEIALRDDFRRLADRLKFSDEDREQLFIAVKNWVVADYRLDPRMDPQDPDAKRLVH